MALGRKGPRVFQAHGTISADGSGINEGISDAVEEGFEDGEKKAEPAGERTSRRFSRGFARRLGGQLGEAVKGRVTQAMGRETDRAGDSAGERFVDRVANKVKETGGKISSELGDRMVSDVEQTRRGIHRAFDDEFADRIARRFADRISERLSERIVVEVRNLVVDDDAVSRNLNRRRRKPGDDDDDRFNLYGDRIGRLFGAGSRNNFLNIIGRSIGGLLKLTETLGRAAFNMGQNFTKGFQSAADGATLLQKIGAGFGQKGMNLSGMFAKIGRSGPAAAVAIAVVSVALSALASVASALVGILTALLSTIVSGLVGGLGVLGGALLAVTTGVGLLTAAFMSMTDAQKKAMGETFQPLRAIMVGFGQTMLQEMIPAFSTWSQNLQNAMGLLVPLIERMGKAFAIAGDIITRSFSGPGFRRFADAMTKFLPSITVNLSSALGGFLNGLLGLFAALMPYVNRFAKYLADVADRFSKWANSAAGQNSISEWVGRALESFQSLWNFVREFFGFLGDVLFSPQAQNAGNTLFDGLTRAFEGFREKIARAQQNGDLERWFQMAIDFARDLRDVIRTLSKAFGALVDSGVLNLVGAGLKHMANSAKLFADVAGAIVSPVETLTGLARGFGGAINWVLRRSREEMKYTTEYAAQNARALNTILSGMAQATTLLRGSTTMDKTISGLTGNADNNGKVINPVNIPKTPDLSKYENAGNSALAATGLGKGKGSWKNPYTAWANSLIKDGPSTMQQIRRVLNTMAAEVRKAMNEFARSTDGAATRSGLTDLGKTLRDEAKNVREIAQNALNDAARSLASASSPKAAAAALKQVRRAQGDLKKAINEQKRLNRAADLVTDQRSRRASAVVKLVNGLKVQNATLAEIARARELIAGRIEKAQAKLEDAISIRDSFQQQIESSIKSYGSLVSATAQTVNGIEQALTAGDVISNLETRLAKIKKFQSDLNILLANGLSRSAYEQLISAGVEGGSATVEALLAGGAGAIAQVNNLVGQIDSLAEYMGKESANVMYQAGVDMAQGLLDGLKALDARLEAQGVKLGNTVANAIKKVLGIKSPSRVAMALMGDFGDGMVIGLNNQQPKVSDAASALAARVAVSPEVAAHAARQGSDPVSGNERGQVFRDLIVQTPTEDPHAVAMETLNELTGRL